MLLPKTDMADKSNYQAKALRLSRYSIGLKPVIRLNVLAKLEGASSLRTRHACRVCFLLSSPLLQNPF